MDNNVLDAYELFVNQMYVPKLGASYKRYLNNNGVLKEFKLGPLASKVVNKNAIWYRLKDLPNFMQASLKDKALSVEDIRYMSDKGRRAQEFYDKEGVKIYVTGTTELIPVVGNFLAQDGMYAYTVVIRDNQVTLKPILSSPHWSDIFAGSSEYGMNVFILASDLPPEKQEFFRSEMIMLKDALDFLEQNRSSRL